MKRISELNFADLLICQSGCYFRYLQGQNLPLVNVPIDYDSEIQLLKMKLDSFNSEQNSEDSFFLYHDNVPYRVSIVETIEGKEYFLRRLNYPTPKLDTLGFDRGLLTTLKSLGKKSQGLILVAGATGSGKSTSVYSLLTFYLENYGDILISIEDPPEVPSQGKIGDGIWFQIDAKTAGGYDRGMVAAMRYNPKYIFMGEIRTPTAAREAIRAAINGHLVVTTIHANSVAGAIFALQQIAASGSDIELARAILSDGLLCVLHQRLDFTSTGNRKLKTEFLYTKDTPSILSKVRSGKLELLNSDIEMQKIKLSKGMSL
ncbi:TPA: Flp pilus assembly complex ATPase component, partial [Escherichia coli]|nr:Flp pilus assembly complex ATPase component [Escherichia coli]HBA8247388.1 Flp pilus assembly complex ATPase component [Escherichia coli]